MIRAIILLVCCLWLGWGTMRADDGVSRQRLAALARGINLQGWFWLGPDTVYERQGRFSDEQFVQMRAIGLTFVRLPIDPYFLLNRADPDHLYPNRLREVDEALDRVLAADLAVIVDLHNFVPDAEGLDVGARLETDDAFVEEYLRFTRAFARHLSARDPDRVFLEVLNEPVFESNPTRWQEILPRLVAAARDGAPHMTLIVSGTAYANISGLIQLTPLDDPNILYNFHFYEPFLFTHQGATWAWHVVQPLRDVPYPSDPDRVRPIADNYEGEIRAELLAYGRERWDKTKLMQILQPALDWAQQHGLTLICTEFGAYRPYAPPQDRAQWLEDVRQLFESHNIGWAMWEYDLGFGLLLDGQPDPNIVTALGLQQPR